jgi:two-component system C4-dicarboxylate transport sensor histidine kinase DctB
MTRPSKSFVFLICAIALVGAATLLTQRIWRENGLRSLQALNEPRVQLVANAVKAEISRQDHLPFVLSLDTDALQALAGDPALSESLSLKLKRISQESDTRALYVIGSSGIVIAGDDFDTPESQIGRDLSDRTYFQLAMKAGRSTFLGVDPASDRVRYYVAHAIGTEPILGAAVVRIEFDRIESAWERAGERVLVTDSGGTVFLASDSAYKYRRFQALDSAPSEETDAATNQYPQGHDAPIIMSIVERRGAAQIVDLSTQAGHSAYLYQSMLLPEYGWTIHRLSDLSIIESDRRDGAIIGAAISIITLSGIFFVRQRQLALIAARVSSTRLSSEVAARTSELSAANAALHAEIDERRNTEAMLRETQNSLMQAGKLAALGQMSTAIAHEINQPLAAIRTFIASTKIYSSRGDGSRVSSNLDLIDSLAERMANITSHLKTFARKSDAAKTEPVDVGRAVDGALLLMESQIRQAGVGLAVEVAPHLYVKGFAVQLEQVLVNLLQNALHAVTESKQPAIHLRAAADIETVRISVSDNGQGISDEHLDQIFDPFFTTKPIGKGVGLGLSISYGIVRDFGGEIRATNLVAGGLEMIVELPRYHPESALSHA